MLNFSKLINATINQLSDSLTKINNEIIQRCSAKATVFNILPALTEYITTDKSLNTVTKSLDFGSSTLCRQHNKLNPSAIAELFHNFIDIIKDPLLKEMGLTSSLFIIDGTGATIDTRINNKTESHGLLVSIMFDCNLQMPVDTCINTLYQEKKSFLISHIKKVKQNDCILFDRNYFSYEIYTELINIGAIGIFRMKRQLVKVKQFANSTFEFDKVIYLKNKTKLRLIKYFIKKNNSGIEIITSYHKKTDLTECSEFILGTNNFSSTAMHIINLYGKRWDIEVSIGILKNNFKLQHSKTYELKKFVQEILLASYIFSYCRFIEFIAVRQLTKATISGFNIIKTKKSKNLQKINFTSLIQLFTKNATQFFNSSKKLAFDAVQYLISKATKGLSSFRINRHYQRCKQSLNRKKNTGKKKRNYVKNEKNEEKLQKVKIKNQTSKGRLISIGKYKFLNTAFKWFQPWFS